MHFSCFHKNPFRNSKHIITVDGKSRQNNITGITARASTALSGYISFDKGVELQWLLEESAGTSRTGDRV